MSDATLPAAPEDRSLPLRRSITATWWYVAGGVIFFELCLTLLIVAGLASGGTRAPVLLGVTAAGLVWVASGLITLADYRRRTPDTPLLRWPRALVPLLGALLLSTVAGLTTGLWTMAAAPLVLFALLLNWQRGLRLRLSIAGTLLLIGLAAIDSQHGLAQEAGERWYQVVALVIVLPLAAVSSLWWWDVLMRLDRARAAEGALAATRERLRLATDVHDLQGHHLQVIALQLELAERLMPRDAEAGMAQLRAARGSVDEARQGTRDLAARFRSVPLGDELANAADLLGAAGARVALAVDPQAALAPAQVLGPVIRETTTNALRHGEGRWARLSLARRDGRWRYEIANDAADDPGHVPGSGLEGIGRRVAEGGGTLEVRREEGTFAVVVTVPDDPGEAR